MPFHPCPKPVRKIKGRKIASRTEKARFEALVKLGCAVSNSECEGRITVHHCFTGIGRRKDHQNTIGLCWMHHLGQQGIDGKKMGKRVWETTCGTEEELLIKVNKLLGKK